MKHVQSIFIFLLIFSCSKTGVQQADNKYSEITDFSPKDTLFRIYDGDYYELGVPCGFANQNGETVIPIGKYTYCFSDTISTFGIVGPIDGHISVGIDQNENKLYEVKWYDSGPDWAEEGLFRIIRNGKIGYADTTGRVIIEPQFDCTHQFKDGKAKVTYDCELIKTGEHTMMKSNSWFYIDKNGNKIK